jgi:hypothetical protein
MSSNIIDVSCLVILEPSMEYWLSHANLLTKLTEN